MTHTLPRLKLVCVCVRVYITIMLLLSSSKKVVRVPRSESTSVAYRGIFRGFPVCRPPYYWDSKVVVILFWIMTFDFHPNSQILLSVKEQIPRDYTRRDASSTRQCTQEITMVTGTACLNGFGENNRGDGYLNIMSILCSFGSAESRSCNPWGKLRCSSFNRGVFPCNVWYNVFTDLRPNG